MRPCNHRTKPVLDLLPQSRRLQNGGLQAQAFAFAAILLLFLAAPASATIAILWNEAGPIPIVNGTIDTVEPIEFIVQFTNDTGNKAGQFSFESPSFPQWTFEATTCGNVTDVPSTSPLIIDLQTSAQPGQTLDAVCIRARAPSCWAPLQNRISFEGRLTYTSGGVTTTESELIQLDLTTQGGVGFQLDKVVVPATNTTATPGEVVDFRLTLRNPVDFQANAFLLDAIPEGTELMAASDFSCTGTAAGSTCQLTQFLDCGSVFTYNLSVRVLDPLPAGLTEIQNVASARQGQRTVTASATLPIDTSARPDLTVTKSAPSKTAPGETIPYTMTVRNIGTVAATGVVVTDTLPPLVTVNETASDPRWTCNPTTCTANLGTLAAGATQSLELFATVQNPVPAGTSSLVNTVVVSTTSAETDPGNNSAQVTTNLSGLTTGPDLAVSKSGPATARPGDRITYEITVTNLGNVGATSPIVNDALPPLVTVDEAASDPRWNCTAGGSCTATLSDLAGGGGSEALDLVVLLDDPLPARTNSMVNSVAVATIDTETNMGNNSALVTTDLAGLPGVGPDLTISKSGPASGRPGDQISYQLTVTNLGNVGATAPVVVDQLPATASFVAAASDPRWTCGGGTCSATLANLAGGGASEVLEMVVRLEDPQPVGVETIVNGASVSTPDTELDDSNNSAEHTLNLEGPGVGPDLTVSKSGPATVAPGQTVTYEILVTNLGNVGATAPTVSDTLPATVTVNAAASDPRWNCTSSICTAILGDLAGGGAAESLELVVTVVDPLPTGTTSVRNSVVVSTDDLETDNGNNSAEHVASVGGGGGTGPDLTVSKTGPATVAPGQTISYEILVTNLGNVGATAPTVSDTLPATVTVNAAASDPRWNCTPSICTAILGDLAGGGAAESLELVVTVVDPLPTGTTSVRNSVVVSTDDLETDNGNNSAEHVASVGGGGGTGPDLTVSKTGPSTAVPGETITFEITVTNTGNVGATAPTVLDTLPPNVSIDLPSSDPRWSCDAEACSATLEDLQGSGASETLHLSVTIDDPLPAGTDSLVNTAAVSTPDLESDDTNNTAEHTVSFLGVEGVSPDLTLTKSGPANAAPGEAISYQITVSNVGNLGATAPAVTDTLPANVTVNPDASDPRWICNQNECTATLGDLTGAGGTETLHLAVTLDDPLPTGVNHIENNALVMTPDPEQDLSNNTAQAVTTISGDGVGPDLTIEKAGPSLTAPGGLLRYRLTVTNQGNLGATAPTITENLPEGVVPDLASSDPRWTCASVSTCSAVLDDLPGGASEVLELVVLLEDQLPPKLEELVNTASVSTPDTETDDTNNSAQLTTTLVESAADVSVVIWSSQAIAVFENTVDFNFVLQNTGPDPATDLQLQISTQGLDLEIVDDRFYECGEDLCLDLAEVPAGFVLDDLLLYGKPFEEVVITAAATASSPDPDLTNNQDRLTLPLLDAAAVPALGPFGLLVAFLALVGCGWRRIRKG